MNFLLILEEEFISVLPFCKECVDEAIPRYIEKKVERKGDRRIHM